MTEAGLNTVNLSALNTFQQFMLFILIMLGSAILVSSMVVYVRKNAFERRFVHIVEEDRKRRRTRSYTTSTKTFQLSLSRRRHHDRQSSNRVDGVVIRGRAIPNKEQSEDTSDYNPGDHPPTERQEFLRPDIELQDKHDLQQENLHNGVLPVGNRSVVTDDLKHSRDLHSPMTPTIRFIESKSPRRHRGLSMSGVGARPDLLNHPRRTQHQDTPIPSTYSTGSRSGGVDNDKNFPSSDFVGRNSGFHSLTPTERARLGGVEYRALRILQFIVPIYYIIFQLCGSVGLGAWVAVNTPDIALSNGLNPW
jgi:hypothetical protein